MPLCYLIFSPQPYDLTEAQVEEERALGHLVEVLGEKPPAGEPPAEVPPALPAPDAPAAEPASPSPEAGAKPKTKET